MRTHHTALSFFFAFLLSAVSYAQPPAAPAPKHDDVGPDATAVKNTIHDILYAQLTKGLDLSNADNQSQVKIIGEWCWYVAGSAEHGEAQDVLTALAPVTDPAKALPAVVLAHQDVFTQTGLRSSQAWTDARERLRTDAGQPPVITTLLWLRDHPLSAGIDRPRGYDKSSAAGLLALCKAGAFDDHPEALLAFSRTAITNEWSLDTIDRFITAYEALPNHDAWAGELLKADLHRAAAWAARGTGAAASVPNAHWKTFNEEIAEAIRHLDAALALRRSRVEPLGYALELQGIGEPGRKPLQDMFNDAVAVDPSWEWSYRIAAGFLRPRWGGSPAKMLAVAQRAAATGLYTSKVPDSAIDIFLLTAAETRDLEGMMADAANYAMITGVAKGYLARPALSAGWARKHHSNLLLADWWAHRYDDAAKELTALGNTLDQRHARRWGAFVDEVLVDVALYTGPDAERARQARAALDAGDWDKAQTLYTQALEATQPQDADRRAAFTSRIQMIKNASLFLSGKSLEPPVLPGLPGFSIERGVWTADNNTLVSTFSDLADNSIRLRIPTNQRFILDAVFNLEGEGVGAGVAYRLGRPGADDFPVDFRIDQTPSGLRAAKYDRGRPVGPFPLKADPKELRVTIYAWDSLALMAVNDQFVVNVILNPGDPRAAADNQLAFAAYFTKPGGKVTISEIAITPVKDKPIEVQKAEEANRRFRQRQNPGG